MPFQQRRSLGYQVAVARNVHFLLDFYVWNCYVGRFSVWLSKSFIIVMHSIDRLCITLHTYIDILYICLGI